MINGCNSHAAEISNMHIPKYLPAHCRRVPCQTLLGVDVLCEEGIWLVRPYVKVMCNRNGECARGRGFVLVIEA